MRRLLLALLLVPLAGGAPLAAAGLLNLIFPRHELQVITVTDATPAASQYPAPSPGQPQYYLATSLGFRDFGGAMGGIKEPANQDAIRWIAAELAKQGYLPAKEDGPDPTLLLVFTWGTLNRDSIGWNPDFPPTQLNREQILRFLGGSKVGFDRSFFDPLTRPVTGLMAYNYDARALYDASGDDFYVIAVGAYDFESVQRKEKPKLLWMTRVAAASLGFNLPEVMPAMLAIAGPQFGRDTPKPVWINASDKFKPNVTLGELQLVEYLGDQPLSVATPPPPKKKR